MLRSIGKSCFAYAYTWTGASRFLSQPAAAGMPFIICLHRVVEDFERSLTGAIPSMLISARMLERQIDWLARRYSIVSLDEIGAGLESGRPFEIPVAAITFDDGYVDGYHHAYPLLKRKGIPAAFFVVTGLVNTGRPQIFDRLYLVLTLLQLQGMPLVLTIEHTLQSIGIDAGKLSQLPPATSEPFAVMTAVLNSFPRQNVERAVDALETLISSRRDLLQEMVPLSWSMIETMHRGGMTIGSHTKSHLLMPSESPETAKRELIESKQVLESRLKTSIHHFAYPDGRFNALTVQAVERAGYRFGYSICHSRDQNRPLLTIPRKVLWERSCNNAFGSFSSAVMNCHRHWAFDSKRCPHDHSTAAAEEKNGTIAAA
jgi:peptidoglycan/xylan/chitin deacetylase (PgdA/CDA1 family)